MQSINGIACISLHVFTTLTRPKIFYTQSNSGTLEQFFRSNGLKNRIYLGYYYVSFNGNIIILNRRSRITRTLEQTCR